MPISVPSSVEFNVPLSVLPARWRIVPDEGDQVIPIEVDWSKGTAQHINIQGLSTQPFKQIVAALINNVRCNSTATLIFPDTGLPIDVPAGVAILMPIASNRLDFYIVATNANSTDRTIIELFNSQPPPVAVSAVQLEATGSSSALALTGAGTAAIVAAGNNGNITAIDVLVSNALGAAGASLANLDIEDGASNVIWNFSFALQAAGFVGAATLLRLSGIVVPFTNGLLVRNTLGLVFTSGTVFANISYQG